jgi:hypothetical protein
MSFKLPPVTVGGEKPITITVDPATITKPEKRTQMIPPYSAFTKIVISHTGTNGTLYHQEHSTKDIFEIKQFFEVLYRWSPNEITIDHQNIRVRYSLAETLARIQTQRRIMNEINSGEACNNCGDTEGECDCDEDEEDTRMTYKDYIDDVIGQITALTSREAFRKESKRLYAAPLIQDKDCPVLLEPLEIGNTSQLPCDHFISTKALYRLDSKKNDSGVYQLECPLCRAKSNIGEALSL